jgi:flagellar basal-body rod protein FlgC
MAENDMFGPIDVSISGMDAFRQSMNNIYSNIANARTVDAGNGLPYRRMELLLKQRVDEELGGVEVDKVVPDPSPFTEIYDPNHPYANSQGFVRMPNVSIAKEMINLNMATRAYQANVAVLRRYQQMVDSTLELLR